MIRSSQPTRIPVERVLVCGVRGFEEDLGMETVLLKPIEADLLVHAIDAAITGLAPRSGKRQRVARH